MAAHPALALLRRLADRDGREGHELLDRGGRCRRRRLLGHGEHGQVSQLLSWVKIA